MPDSYVKLSAGTNVTDGADIENTDYIVGLRAGVNNIKILIPALVSKVIAGLTNYVTLTGSQIMTNKQFTYPKINTGTESVLVTSTEINQLADCNENIRDKFDTQDSLILSLDSAVSELQDQIDAKATIESPTFTGTVVLPATTSIGVVDYLEILYLNGAQSNIQNQINALATPVAKTYQYNTTFVADDTNKRYSESDILTALGISSAFVILTPLTAMIYDYKNSTHSAPATPQSPAEVVEINVSERTDNGQVHFEAIEFDNLIDEDSYSVSITFRVAARASGGGV